MWYKVQIETRSSLANQRDAVGRRWHSAIRLNQHLLYTNPTKWTIGGMWQSVWDNLCIPCKYSFTRLW